jgi:hypothetical protein
LFNYKPDLRVFFLRRRLDVGVVAAKDGYPCLQESNQFYFGKHLAMLNTKYGKWAGENEKVRG